jgi:hypothetical protein
MIEVRVGAFGWRFIAGDIKELGGGRGGATVDRRDDSGITPTTDGTGGAVMERTTSWMTIAERR